MNETTNMPKYCEVCTVALRPDAAFCSACGHPVSGHENQNQKTGSRWELFRPALQLWCTLLVVNGVVALGLKIAGDVAPWVSMLVPDALFFGALVFFVWRDRASLALLFRGIGYRGLRVAEPLIAVLILWPIMVLYWKLLGELGVGTVSYLEEFSAAGWPLWSAYVIYSLFPAVTEELAFRGIIMDRLTSVTNSRDALIVQAAMFSVLHLLPASYISHFFIGLVLGLIRLRSGRLLPCILTHALWNAWVITEEALATGWFKM